MSCIITRKSRASIREKLHHWQTYMRHFSHRRSKPHAHHETHLHTMKAVTIAVSARNAWPTMNDFPVIGDLVIRKGLWDRQGETLQVAAKKCMTWSCFSDKKGSVFGHRMPHFVVILWEAEETSFGALKLQVFVGMMQWNLSINTLSCEKVDCEIYRTVSKYIVLTFN